MESNQIITKMELITPEKAAELLKFNVANRAINQGLVEYYAKQMIDGQWTVSGQTISLSSDGVLIDGQHRLAAIIKSKKSILFNVAKNVPVDSFINYDNAKSRTSGDALFIAGVPSSKSVSAIITSYFYISRGLYGSAGFSNGGETGRSGTKDKRRKSNLDILYFYRQHSELIQKTQHLTASYRKKFKYFVSSKNGSIILFLILNKFYEENFVFGFFKQLYSGEDITNKSIFYLREKYIQSIGNGTVLTEKTKLFFLVKCWNAYVKGKEIKTYYAKDTDEIPNFL